MVTFQEWCCWWIVGIPDCLDWNVNGLKGCMQRSAVATEARSHQKSSGCIFGTIHYTKWEFWDSVQNERPEDFLWDEPSE